LKFRTYDTVLPQVVYRVDLTPYAHLKVN